MQAPNSNSTLELVVNEQQLQNMSQIDLSDRTNADRAQNLNDTGGFNLQQLKKWPKRFKEGFNAKLDEAKAKSDTKTEFAFEVINAFSGIIIWVLCFVCTITVPVFLFLIGLVNLDDCPDRPSLPYLIFATGFVMTASNLFNLALALDLPVLTNHQILTSEIKNTIASIINMIFNCVVTFLYILSAYMVFTINHSKRQQINPITDEGGAKDGSVQTQPPVNGAEEENNDTIDCNWLLYHFSFWFIAITLGLLVLLVVLGTILYCYNRYRLAIIRGSTPRSQPNASPSPIDPYTTNRL